MFPYRFLKSVVVGVGGEEGGSRHPPGPSPCAMPDVGYFYYKLIQIETIYLKNESQTGVFTL